MTLYINARLCLSLKYCGKGPSVLIMEESSYVSWPLIAMGKFKNVQLDGELKTSGLQLFFLFLFFPPKRSRQQPLFTLSLIYYSLFLISPIFAGQLRVGGEEGTRKKKNQWLDKWKCRVSVWLWAANGDSGEQNKHRTNRDGLPGNWGTNFTGRVKDNAAVKIKSSSLLLSSRRMMAGENRTF